MRINDAKIPPTKNAMLTTTRYMMPMRLWSLVSSHDATVCWWFRYVTRGAASVVSMVLPVLLRWRRRRSGGVRGGSAAGRLQRLHVLDERHHALFVDQTLESRHQRLEPGHDLPLRR